MAPFGFVCPESSNRTLCPSVKDDFARWAKPIVQIKQRKVRFRADTSMPTTTCTTRFGRLKKPPPPKRMVVIFRKEIEPLRRGKQRMASPHNAVLKAKVSKLVWVTATFVPTKRLFGARERSLSQGHHQRPWLGVPTSSNVWTSVIPRCHQSPIGGSVHIFSSEQ